MKKFNYYFMVFILGAFIGWIYEICFYFITENNLTNPGFLYGPYLPVYGYGALLMVLLFKPLKKQPVLIFIFSMLLTGVLEYFTGKIMVDIWHRTWWDYTGLFLNIDGYVCLRSVLSFAIGGEVLIYFIEPQIQKLLDKEFTHQIDMFLNIFMVIFLADNLVSFLLRHPI